MTRPEISFDDNIEVVTINGTRYTYSFFEDLGAGGLADGAIVQVMARLNDAAHFTRHFGMENGRAIRCIALATLLRAANRPYQAKELGDLASIALEGEP